MSPEQAAAKPLDARSDVFSFGAVLYELLAGTRAFTGDSTAQILSAVLRDDPSPFEAPAALQQIVKRCLAKDPDRRFQTMADVRHALQHLTGGSADVTASIAVLPFANLSADRENEYFGDGLAEEIINALAQVEGLKVIARTSAFSFKGKNEDVRHIAQALGVTNVLEGSVRRAGDRIRVTAQLIAAADGAAFSNPEPTSSAPYQEQWEEFEAGFWETEINAGRIRYPPSSFDHWLIARSALQGDRSAVVLAATRGDLHLTSRVGSTSAVRLRSLGQRHIH